jgi:AhpD family alkylhydroperoxidase
VAARRWLKFLAVFPSEVRQGKGVYRLAVGHQPVQAAVAEVSAEDTFARSSDPCGVSKGDVTREQSKVGPEAREVRISSGEFRVLLSKGAEGKRREMETLDPKTKELVGIAAAVAGLCQPCFDHHFAEAQKLGITTEEIRETVRLAQAIRQAGKGNMDKYIQAKLQIQRAEQE